MAKNDFVSGYLSAIGRKGGTSKSPAKVAAARRNAKKAAAARRKKGSNHK
jgi:hypothetical protein